MNNRKTNKRRTKSFRKNHRRSRKRTIKKRTKKSIAKLNYQSGGVTKQNIKELLKKANTYANKYIQSSGGKSVPNRHVGGISLRNMFKKKDATEAPKVETPTVETPTVETPTVEAAPTEAAPPEAAPPVETPTEAEVATSRFSKFKKFIKRKTSRTPKADPIEPDLSATTQKTDDKVMIDKEKDKYVWIRVNVPKENNVLVQSDTGGTFEETVKNIKNDTN